jgi:ABC-2 type transport system ATP-binding protein
MIEIENVTRKYGERVAVSNLDLRIEPGEVFAFLGHNGAGKTTTIKMMVGLLQPTSGHVRIRGIDVAQQPREASHFVGYVPDEPYLYEKLTGREFLEFTAEMYGLDAHAARESITQRIADFELQPFVDRLAEGYSHGMRQRVIFASALVHQPPVLVVDEPMVGLDPRSMRFVKGLLRRQAEQGATVFLSTHTLSVAEEIADRIGIIDDGSLKFLGSVQDLRRQLQAADSSLEDLFLSLTNPPENSAPSATSRPRKNFTPEPDFAEGPASEVTLAPPGGSSPASQEGQATSHE